MSRRRTRPGASSRRRFARRAWARRWASLRRVLVLLVVLALVAGAGWLVFVSSVLAVQRVQVSGVHTVPRQRVVSAAAVRLGEPLARVDVDAVRARVERMPIVAHADIGRSWPHTLTVDVTERTPVAAVPAGGGYRLIDAEGVRYRTVPRRPAHLPALTASDPRAAREAAAVAAALPRRLTRRVAGIEAPTMDSIRLRLRDGRSVVWGSAQDSALKARVLRELLGRDAQVYDVSVPGAPTLTVG